jgi:branched-chain amino acid aminotransferase
MINFNGNIVSPESNVLQNNRGFLFGDAVFETLKIVDNKILFLEDHYFRLMSSMRIVRMEIPMNFTLEFIENEILSLAKANNFNDSARIRFTVYRNSGGYYLPETNEISYLISAKLLENKLYSFNNSDYEVDLFKDSYITKQLLSTIKTTNKMVNITGSIFAKENDLDNCLLMNDSKNIVEALNGNIFMLLNNKLISPPISEGCLNGIMRKQIINIVKKIDNIEIVEEIISPFDIQKADELFITNVISGIQPITKYRKKTFETKTSNLLLIELNNLIKSV